MNKREIELSQSVRLINHGPCILVSVGDGTRDNLFTVAWNMPIRKNPPLVAIESSKSHHSYPFIETTEEFCINVPPPAIAEKVLAAGKVSGAAVEDKFADVGLTREPSSVIKAPRVAEAAAHLECRTVRVVDFDTSALIIGEVVAAAAAEHLFEDGMWQPQNGEGLLHHLGGNNFCVSTQKRTL